MGRAVIVALLAAIARVHVEKWALGAHVTDRSGAEEWERAQGEATEAECWPRFTISKLIGADADIVRTVVEGYTTTAYYRDGTKYVAEFTCLPDGVDPRAP